MCDKVVNTYPSAIKFVSECITTQEMSNKVVNICFFYLVLFLIDIKLNKWVTELFLKIFLIVHCPDKLITQKMCYKAVDDSLATLKLIPDWFVTSKIIK